MAADIDMITVALATYKRPQQLQRALEALALQRHHRLHVLVSDDAPTEECARIASSAEGVHVTYLPRHARLGVLRNHLSMIQEASSDMFMFHGDDDELLPDALSQLSEPLKTTLDHDLVFGNYRVGPTPQCSRAVSLTRLPFVRYWRHRDRHVRMLAYYLCPAFLGKQNLFYSLYRTEALRRIDVDKTIPPRQHHLNMDEMFAFQAVCNGRALVIGHECHFFAEGNVKHYVDAPVTRAGVVGALIEFVRYEWITLFDYLRNVRGLPNQVLLLCLFPMKFMIALAWRYVPWLR